MQAIEFKGPAIGLGLHVSEAVLTDCLLTILMKRADEREAALHGTDAFGIIRALSVTADDIARSEQIIRTAIRFQPLTVERVWDRFCAEHPTAKGGGDFSLPLESEATPC